MNDSIAEVVIHPVHNHAIASSEHPEGQYKHIGDALGRDVTIVKFVDGWMRPYAGEGRRNEDWYGWRADVLAPFDGVVESVYINPVENTPGVLNPGRAGSVVFCRDDGVNVCFAHVTDVHVGPGNRVKAGEVVAKVGNNGYSRHPHIHIGAWKGGVPLQIRFDLRAMGKQLQELGEAYYT